jgi:hypothetical protein
MPAFDRALASFLTRSLGDPTSLATAQTNDAAASVLGQNQVVDEEGAEIQVDETEADDSVLFEDVLDVGVGSSVEAASDDDDIDFDWDERFRVFLSAPSGSPPVGDLASWFKNFRGQDASIPTMPEARLLRAYEYCNGYGRTDRLPPSPSSPSPPHRVLPPAPLSSPSTSKFPWPVFEMANFHHAQHHGVAPDLACVVIVACGLPQLTTHDSASSLVTAREKILASATQKIFNHIFPAAVSITAPVTKTILFLEMPDPSSAATACRELDNLPSPFVEAAFRARLFQEYEEPGTLLSPSPVAAESTSFTPDASESVELDLPPSPAVHPQASPPPSPLIDFDLAISSALAPLSSPKLPASLSDRLTTLDRHFASVFAVTSASLAALRAGVMPNGGGGVAPGGADLSKVETALDREIVRLRSGSAAKLDLDITKVYGDVLGERRGEGGVFADEGTLSMVLGMVNKGEDGVDVDALIEPGRGEGGVEEVE